MGWSKDGPGDDGRGGRKGYHHGNLREALIRAALNLIGEKGPAGFTFADAARAAGVSSAAPYRHFRDRDALMADIAKRGFELFRDSLQKAWNDGKPNLYVAFEEVGRAYLAFARNEPAHYSAMFEAGIALDSAPGLQQAADDAFAVLRSAAEALSAHMPKESRPPAFMMSLHIWALAHGTASLFARGDAGRRKLPMPAEDLLEAAILVYLRGLGLTGGK
jgi:AcrR family transcriptional regulator